MSCPVYEEHALSHGSSSKAMSYVGITCDGKMYWGAGMDEDIIKASIQCAGRSSQQTASKIQ